MSAFTFIRTADATYALTGSEPYPEEPAIVIAEWDGVSEYVDVVLGDLSEGIPYMGWGELKARVPE